uniref:Uncharacterized protein n=1 Tax=Panagrolaimus superbus TaxID=310955 RepID=A0A914YJX1_9BILA
MVEMAWLAAPYHNVNSNEAQASLRVLLDKVVKKFDLTLYPVQRLDELETATVFNSCGMTISMSKRLRSLLGDNNIFASANKVNELLKTFDAQCEIKVENIEVEDTEIEVSTVENLFTAITNRYQKIADRKKFKLNPSSFENEIWISILGDKGGKSMKLALALGNQDSPNAPDKLLLCGMYDGPSTAKLIYAAFQKLASKIEDIDNIELKIDGVIKKFKVRWCTFAKVNPNTFETAGACDKGTLRQKFEIGTDSGQEHEPLFLNIPPNQSKGGMLSEVSVLTESLKNDIDKRDFAVENLKTKLMD